MSDIKVGDIIRVVRNTNGVSASKHLMRVTKCRGDGKVIHARYLTTQLELPYGTCVIDPNLPIESQSGLVLGSNRVEKI